MIYLLKNNFGEMFFAVVGFIDIIMPISVRNCIPREDLINTSTVNTGKLVSYRKTVIHVLE